MGIYCSGFVLLEFTRCLAFLLILKFQSNAVSVYHQPTVNIGLFGDKFDSTGAINVAGAQAIASMVMAIKEINNKTDGIFDKLLPHTQILFALRSTNGNFLTASDATQDFALRIFNGKGVVGEIGTGYTESSRAMGQTNAFTTFGVNSIDYYANSSDLSHGDVYPYYERTCPSEGYDGFVLARIIKFHFGWNVVNMFFSSDTYGSDTSSVFIKEASHLGISIENRHSFWPGTTDFSYILQDTMASGIRKVFVLIMKSADVGALLEAGYNAGLFTEGTQILGTQYTLLPAVWQAMSINAPVANIMKGLIAIKPTLDRSTSDYILFSSRFLNQTDTKTVHSDGSATCNLRKDDDGGQYLYTRDPASNLASDCAGVIFSSMDPSDVTDVAAYAYDAVLGMAIGLHQVIYMQNKVNYTGNDLVNIMLGGHYVNYTGATGYVEFYMGVGGAMGYGLGDRQTDLTYKVLNFNPTFFHKYGQNLDLSIRTLGTWKADTNVFTPCNASKDDYCSSAIYNTKDGLIVINSLPKIVVNVQPLLATQQIVIISVVCPLVVFAVLGYAYWRKRLSEKAALKIVKKQVLKCLPIHMMLLNGCGPRKVASKEYIMEVIEANIHTVHCCDGDGKTVVDIIVQGHGHVNRGVCLDESHIYRILVECLPHNIRDPTLDEVKPRKRSYAFRSEKNFDTESGTSQAIVSERRFPIKIEDFPTKPPTYGWCLAVQRDDDMFVTVVEKILSEYRQHAKELGDIEDDNRRKCKEIAGARIKESIARKLYLAERFQVDERHPVHKSATSQVYFAIDHGDPKTTMTLEPNKSTENADGKKSARSLGAAVHEGHVALKLMRDRDQFLREVSIREKALFSPAFVLPIIKYYGDPHDDDVRALDREVYMAFREDACRKGHGEYLYCIVMEAGRYSLKHVIDHERIVAKDWDRIRDLVRCLTKALQHMHEKGVVHGDIKPLNVLVVGTVLKLIDLDAAANYKEGDVIGMKFSSAYSPPEMFTLDKDTDKVRVRSEVDDEGLLLAHPSQDMWALGCVLYLLCAGHTLFHSSTDDNLAESNDFYTVYNWDSSLLTKKLHSIEDKLARNLLSFLLDKDPTKRPDASRVLSHPFLTGTIPTRLQGDKAEWDIFLSYRVASDSQIAELLYDALTAMGLKVWWDRRCLLPGQNWEEGFCKGLVSSAYFVCLLSRGAIKNEQNMKSNFEKLTKDSPCDNVLLEWRLSLELKERGMISGVYPIMIGDYDSISKQYGKYSRQGCHPKGVNTTVDSVELKLREHLSREGLGSPYKDSVTVYDLINTITSNQGGSFVGDAITAVNSSTKAIVDMTKPKNSFRGDSLNKAAKIIIGDNQKRRMQEQKIKIEDLSRDNAELKERLVSQEQKMFEYEQRRVEHEQHIFEQERHILELLATVKAMQSRGEENETGASQVQGPPGAVSNDSHIEHNTASVTPAAAPNVHDDIEEEEPRIFRL